MFICSGILVKRLGNIILLAESKVFPLHFPCCRIRFKKVFGGLKIHCKEYMKYKPKHVAMDWIESIWNTKLPQQSKLLACYLRRFMNSQKDMAYPSYARIIDETGLSRATVAKYLEVLESEGWLVRDSGRKGKNTVYYAAFPKQIEQAAKEIESSLAGKLVENTSSPAKPSSLGAKLSSSPAKHELNNKPNNELDNIIIYAHFDDFYSIYPKKKDKAKAQKIWDKLKIEQDSDIYHMIIYHVSNAYLNTEHQYIPYPTTYLNGRRWEDEIDKPKEKSSTRDLPIEHHFTDTGWADGLN